MKILFRSITSACTVAALLLGNSAKAQTTPANKFNLNFGIETGLPTGNVAQYASFTLGGTIRLQYGITDNLAVMFTTGGYHFFKRADYGVGPVKAGLKEFFVPNIYVAIEGGIGREALPSGFYGGQTKLLIAPGVGYANKHWDFGVRYESLTGDGNNYGIAGLRVAYGFGL